MRTETRPVLPGEAVTPIPDTTAALAWSVYLRTEADQPPILLVSWPAGAAAVAINSGADADLMPVIAAIAGTAQGPALTAAALKFVEPHLHDRRSLQVIWYGGMGQAVWRVLLDFGDRFRTDLDAQIAADEGFLEAAEKARTDSLATGLLMLVLPDGTTQQYKSPRVLDSMVAEVRARLNLLRRGQSGHQLVGTQYR